MHGAARTVTEVAATVVALAALAAGCGADADEGPLPERETAAGPDYSDAALWLSFDDDEVGFDGAPQFPDALDRPLAGRVETANGGAVDQVTAAEGRGGAVGFPEKCTAPTGCPRALVEVEDDAALDPGTSPFEFGAAVWLAPDQTSSGSNIVQKGRFATDGGQWKLQVDSDEGEPSCVIRSGTDLVEVRSSVTIADSAWHEVACRRDADGISIRVDDTVDREDGATGSVDNEWPVRIGSPGVGDDDDQFHGRVDDVFLRIEG